MPTSLKHPSFWQQGTSNDARGRAYVQGLVQGKRKAGRRRATPWPQTDRSTRPCRPWFSVFACVDQNATLAAGLEFLSDSGCTGRGGLGRDHESGQRVNGSRHVEQLWIGVNVRGQLGLGMPHCGLSRPKRNARGAQVGAESHSEGVHVHDAIPFVTLNHYSVTRLPRPPFKVFRCARFAEIPWFHRSSEIGRDRGVLAAAERASKPNSVVGDHLSGPEVALRLEHPTRSFGTAVGEFGMANGRHSRLCFSLRVIPRDGPPLAAYMGLLAVGFALPRLSPIARCGSYRTISPLQGQGPAVFFCGTFPSDRSGLGLPTTVPCPVRTFLPGETRAVSRASRPSDRLRPLRRGENPRSLPLADSYRHAAGRGLYMLRSSGGSCFRTRLGHGHDAVDWPGEVWTGRGRAPLIEFGLLGVPRTMSLATTTSSPKEQQSREHPRRAMCRGFGRRRIGMADLWLVSPRPDEGRRWT